MFTEYPVDTNILIYHTKGSQIILKYIDEQFHVENDYIFYLDFNRYNIVPDFVLPKCIEFLNKEGVA